MAVAQGLADLLDTGIKDLCLYGRIGEMAQHSREIKDTFHLKTHISQDLDSNSRFSREKNHRFRKDFGFNFDCYSGKMLRSTGNC